MIKQAVLAGLLLCVPVKCVAHDFDREDRCNKIVELVRAMVKDRDMGMSRDQLQQRIDEAANDSTTTGKDLHIALTALLTSIYGPEFRNNTADDIAATTLNECMNSGD